MDPAFFLVEVGWGKVRRGSVDAGFEGAALEHSLAEQIIAASGIVREDISEFLLIPLLTICIFAFQSLFVLDRLGLNEGAHDALTLAFIFLKRGDVISARQ